MSIQNLLDGKVHYNQRLSEEFDKDLVSYDAQGKLIPPTGSNLLYFLKKDLTYPYEQNTSAIESTMGISFTDQDIRQTIQKDSKLQQSISQEPVLRNALTKNNQTLENITFETYLDMGEAALTELKFNNYIRFSTNKVRAYAEVSQDQKKYFDRTRNTGYETNLRDLFIGNAGERAMQELVFALDKESIARSFLMHNASIPQEEKDSLVWFYNIKDMKYDKKSLGVRSQRNFSGNYLYGKYRIQNRRESIADYVAFFNNIGHHIFYLTGIVEKEFLRGGIGSEDFNPMLKFPFPEHYYFLDIYQAYNVPFDFTATDPKIIAQIEQQQKLKLQEAFSKRISPELFFDNLKNMSAKK
jgi:hypothetical protein